MNTAFPFGLPGATATYLSLYVLTFAVHIILMGYVLAGTGYVAASAARRALSKDRPNDPIATMVADWLPFGLGAAITAGVAPLLFLQILYRKSFYTANLLLFHRWMAIVPVLIAGFYLLYLHKAKRTQSWRPWLRAAVPAATFACFVFVAYSWTENHLLAMDPAAWVPFYAEERIAYRSSGLLPRLGMWVAGSLPALVAIAALQMRGAAKPRAVKRLAAMGIAGVVAMLGCAATYASTLDAVARTALDSSFVAPYLIAGVLGAIAQLAGWALALRAGVLTRLSLALVSAGVVLVTLGIAVARESLRLSRFADEALFQVHARAAEASGLILFLAFLVGNALVIAWCFRMTVRGLREPADPGE